MKKENLLISKELFIKEIKGNSNNFEKILLENKLYYLSFFVRISRIGHKCNFNSEISFIILINLLLSEIINRKMNEYSVEKVLMTQRDCCLIDSIFSFFYPSKITEKLYCSRKALSNSTDSFVNYYKHVTQDPCLIFDMNGTGFSIYNFCLNNNLELNNVKILYALLFKNNKSQNISNNFYKKIDYIIKDIEFVDVLEILNLDVLGRVINHDHIPIRENVKYNLDLIYKIHCSLAKSLDNSKFIKKEIIRELGELDYEYIISILKSTMRFIKKTYFYKMLKYHHYNDV